jgi:hypothetical protein
LAKDYSALLWAALSVFIYLAMLFNIIVMITQVKTAKDIA